MPDAVRIRRARPEEFVVCRMLLPAGIDRGFGVEYLVAVQDSPPFVVGAASYLLQLQSTSCIRLRVVRTHRRQRIGSRLMAGIEELSLRQGVDALAAVADAVTEPDAAPFLAHRGFTLQNRSKVVRAPTHSVLRAILPLEERLRARSNATVEIVPMSNAPIAAVTALYKTELARAPWTTPWSLLSAISAEPFASSPVVLHDGKVAGFLLYQMEQRTAVIHARIVAPEFKGGPTNLHLMAAAIRSATPHQPSAIEFEIPQDNKDTEKLARRVASEIVRTRDHYYRSLK